MTYWLALLGPNIHKPMLPWDAEGITGGLHPMTNMGT
jgi:hypothetical protein